MGADAAGTLRMGMPPVHHVPFFVLMAAGVQNPLPGKLRCKQEHVYRVLELIPEAKGATALIEAGPALKAAGACDCP